MNDANYEWLFLIPEGWVQIAQQMIEECEAIFPDFEIYDLKEKFGTLRCYHNGSEEIDDIINKYEIITSKICCKCGKPATKYSTGWILPWCDNCGTKEYGPYKEFNHDSTAPNNN